MSVSYAGNEGVRTEGMLQPDTFSCNDCTASASTIRLDGSGCETDAATMLPCGGNTVGGQVKIALVLFVNKLTYTVHCVTINKPC